MVAGAWGGDPQAACAASPRSRCPPPPTPCLGLALCIKFKGFKCKYFSFIDASCLQRACFLAAQLYCPISFPYLGTGEPGALGEGVSRGRGAEAPELEAAPQGTVSGPVGSPGQRGRGEEGAPPRSGGTFQIPFSPYLKRGKQPALAQWLPFSPSQVSPPRLRSSCSAASPFTRARQRSQSEAIRIENLCKTAVS